MTENNEIYDYEPLYDDPADKPEDYDERVFLGRSDPRLDPNTEGALSEMENILYEADKARIKPTDFFITHDGVKTSDHFKASKEFEHWMDLLCNEWGQIKEENRAITEQALNTFSPGKNLVIDGGNYTLNWKPQSVKEYVIDETALELAEPELYKEYRRESFDVNAFRKEHAQLFEKYKKAKSFKKATCTTKWKDGEE